VGRSLDRTGFTDEHQDLAAAYADHAAVALQYATAQQPISNSTATTESPTPQRNSRAADCQPQRRR
jgi:hypothetical protein